jgi:hypothetical protein
MRKKRKMEIMLVIKDTVLIKEAKNTEMHYVYWAVPDDV